MSHYTRPSSIFTLCAVASLFILAESSSAKKVYPQKPIYDKENARIVDSMIARFSSSRNMGPKAETDHGIRVDFPSCALGAEFQKCAASCSNSTTSGSCFSGDCCMQASGGIATMCSKTCCAGFDAAGNPAKPNPCNSQHKCFAGDAFVELDYGARKQMFELDIGDRVKVGPGTYSDVFMFTHKDPQIRTPFVSIRTCSGHVISLSPGHYLYLNGVLARSHSASVGDEVMLGDGSASTVVAVEELEKIGLYNPQTIHGDIVVDGVVASTYTSAISPEIGHAWLAVVRALYTIFGMSGGVFEKGSDTTASLLPSGPSTC